MKLKIDMLPKADAWWKFPSPPAEGDASPDQIHLEVGRALSHWELLEASLAPFFGRLAGDHGMGTATRVYGVISSSGGRREALREAFRCAMEMGKIDPVERGRMNTLLKHYQEAGFRRNDIAHGHVIEVQRNDAPSHHFLVPPGYDSTKTGMKLNWDADPEDLLSLWGWNFQLTAGAIERYRSQLGDLWLAMSEFEVHLLRTTHLGAK